MRSEVRVQFKDRREIRMGSPHNVCRLHIAGTWQPKLDPADWHDVQAASPDGRYIGLVRWDTRGNTPGFRLVVLDTKAERVFRGRRIAGVCCSLRWSGGGFSWQSSLNRRGRFAFFCRR